MSLKTLNINLIRFDFLLIVFCLTIFANRAMSQNEIRALNSEELPRFLYSWTTPESLLNRAEELSQFPDKVWPQLGPLEEGVLIAQNWPQILKNQRALFAWSTVLSPTGPDLNERYGEILVRFEIDREKLKALYLSGSQGQDNDVIDLSNVDLIFHDHKRFREWILLNPDVIKAVTADPEKMKTELHLALVKLKDDQYKFSKNEVHGNFYFDRVKDEGGVFIDSNSRKYAIYRIQKFLSHGRQIVPAIFLNSPSSLDLGLRKRIREFKMQDYSKYLQEAEKNEMLGWSDLDDLYKWSTLKKILALRRAVAYYANDSLGLSLENWSDFFNRVEFEFDKVDEELGRHVKKSKIYEFKKILFEKKPNSVSLMCENLF